VGPTSQITETLTKSEHPFRDESNHTKIIQFRYQMDLQILNFLFWKILEKSDFSSINSRIHDINEHEIMKHNQYRIMNTYPNVFL